jgi:hypothetical protein
MLKNPRYQNAGVSRAQTTDDFARALHNGGYYTDSLEHYQRGMRAAEQRYFMDGAGGRQAPHITNQTTVEVGGIHIMQPNATPAQIEEASTRAITKALQRQTQRDLVQMAGAY